MRFEIYGANNLNFVEFNITGDNTSYVRCDEDSVYMDTDLFNLFSECFEKSNQVYDYFGPTKYNSRNIIVLLNSLKQYVEDISKIDTLESFIDFTGSRFLGSNFVIELEKIDKSWRLNWDLHKKKLSEINQHLIDLVNHCIEEEKILWLIGY
jgi:hypothetical protein